jgi:hypothetical protein
MVTLFTKSSLQLDENEEKLQEGRNKPPTMDLQPHIDVAARIHAEIKQLPPEVRLQGNAALGAIAREFLKAHEIRITEHGVPVQLLSMEEYGTLFFAGFLEDMAMPQGHYLLYSIPEFELQYFADHHGIAWIEEPKSDIRIMLDNIAQEQPQTFFSLLRSAQRLQAILRKEKSN